MNLHGQDESACGGRGNRQDVEKTEKLINDLKKILPSLPDDLMEKFADELQTDLQVFSLEDDLRHADEDELEKIKALRGSQKNRFLEYAKSLRGPSKSTTSDIAIDGLKAKSAHIGGFANYYDRTKNRKGKAEYPENMKSMVGGPSKLKVKLQNCEFEEDPLVGQSNAYVDESTNDEPSSRK